jgi:hypothetical protein
LPHRRITVPSRLAAAQFIVGRAAIPSLVGRAAQRVALLSPMPVTPVLP